MIAGLAIVASLLLVFVIKDLGRLLLYYYSSKVTSLKFNWCEVGQVGLTFTNLI